MNWICKNCFNVNKLPGDLCGNCGNKREIGENLSNWDRFTFQDLKDDAIAGLIAPQHQQKEASIPKSWKRWSREIPKKRWKSMITSQRCAGRN